MQLLNIRSEAQQTKNPAKQKQKQGCNKPIIVIEYDETPSTTTK